MTNMTNVDIESGKVQVEVFSQTEAALALLREKYGTVPDVKTTTGYELCATGLKKIVKYRTTLEKTRKEIKDPYLKAGQIIDAEAKRITGELLKLEGPLADAKKEVDDHEKRMKEERIAKLRAKINDMTSYVERARNQPSDKVAQMIETVDAIDTQGEFYDLREEALNAQQTTLEKLGDIYSDRIQFEQAEAARKEAEEKQRAQEAAQRISERINKLRMMPMDYMGKAADEVRTKLESLRKFTPPADEFGSRLADAQEAQATVIGQLEMMLQQAEQLEAAKAQQEAQQRASDEQLKRDMESARKEPAPDNTLAELRATTPRMAQAEAERTAGAGVIPDSEKLDINDAIEQHKQAPTLISALSDWCDKWDVSLQASKELWEIIEAYNG